MQKHAKGVFKSFSTKIEPVFRMEKYIPSMGRCNILLFGASGVGKSSIVNSMKSTSDTIAEEADIRKGSLGQCTVSYDTYKFNEKVSICDTWGVYWDEKGGNYPGVTFSAILSGQVESGTSLGTQIYTNAPKQDERLIDAVIFAIGADAKNNSSLLECLREYYEICTEQFNLPCFFAVTKIDEWYETKMGKSLLLEREVRHAGSLVHHNKEWRKIVTEIQKGVKDPAAVVLPVINYNHLDTFTNPIVQFFTREFVKNLCQKIERHYRTVPVPPEEVINKEEIMFKDEKPKEISYQRDQQEIDVTQQKFENIEVRELYAPTESYVTCLKLGRRRWRFVYSGSYINGNFSSCILYNPDYNIIFESGSPKINNVVLKRSFEERRIPKYVFLDSKGGNPLPDFSSSISDILKLVLADNVTLVMKKVDQEKGWTKHHATMLTLAHVWKDRFYETLKYEDKIKVLRQELIDFSEWSVNEIRKLDVKLKKHILKVAQQQQQLQQQQQNTSASSRVPSRSSSHQQIRQENINNNSPEHQQHSWTSKQQDGGDGDENLDVLY